MDLLPLKQLRYYGLLLFPYQLKISNITFAILPMNFSAKGKKKINSRINHSYLSKSLIASVNLCLSRNVARASATCKK